MLSGLTPSRISCFIAGFHVHAYEYYDPTIAHQNPYWELNYFFEEGLRTRIGSASTPWQVRPKGRVHLLAPGTRSWTGSTQRGRPIRGAWITFCPAGMMGIERLLPFKQSYGIIDDPSGRLGSLIDDWDQTLQGLSEDEAVFARQTMAGPLLDIFRRAIPVADGCYRILSLPPSARAGVFVSRLRQYVSQRYMDPLRLSDMARRLGVSPSCLSHRYARMANDTPTAFLLRTRVEMAVKLIKRGFQPKDIVARTGFCDLPHLTRTFKQLMGVTPGQFRKTMDHKMAREDIGVRGGDLSSNTALIGAANLIRRRLDSDSHAHASWVLDAFLTPGVGFRDRVGGTPDTTHGPGWLRLYRPGQKYWEDDSVAARPIVSLSITFFVIRGSEFWQKFDAERGVVNIHDPKGTATELMRTLVAASATYWADPARHGQNVFRQLLGEVLAASQTGATDYVISSADTLPAWSLRLQRFMREHLHEKITVPRLAGVSGFTVSKMNREYKRGTGELPRDTLARLRVNRAESLLTEGRHLDDVAALVGFQDARSLSRALKRRRQNGPDHSGGGV